VETDLFFVLKPHISASGTILFRITTKREA
jgi:hypothetical protein